MGTTRALHYVFIQTECVSEWKRTLYAVWSAQGLEGACYFCMVLLFKMVRPWGKKSTLCIRIYHQQFGLCLMAMDFLFLNLRTILLCTLKTMIVFLQTAKNSNHQLQEMQTTCQAQTPPFIRSQTASPRPQQGSRTSKQIRQNFWHQTYNSGTS